MASATRRLRRETTATSVVAEDSTHGKETTQGRIVNSWPERDYVFIRDDEEVDWFGHKKDFLKEADWTRRKRGVRCAFLKGDWHGKPRAIAVRLETQTRSVSKNNETSPQH